MSYAYQFLKIKTALSNSFALRTTNKEGKVLFCQRAKSERRGTPEIRPISNTLATLAPHWWPELVLTTCLGSKCPCDSQISAGIMKQGGMPLQGFILQLEEIIPHILCQHSSCFNGKPWDAISGMSFHSPALYTVKVCC